MGQNVLCAEQTLVVGLAGVGGRGRSWELGYNSVQCFGGGAEPAERLSGQVCGALPVGKKVDIRTI